MIYGTRHIFIAWVLWFSKWFPLLSSSNQIFSSPILAKNISLWILSRRYSQWSTSAWWFWCSSWLQMDGWLNGRNTISTMASKFGHHCFCLYWWSIFALQHFRILIRMLITSTTTSRAGLASASSYQSSSSSASSFTSTPILNRSFKRDNWPSSSR